MNRFTLTLVVLLLANLALAGDNAEVELSSAFLQAIGKAAGLSPGHKNEVMLNNAFLKAFGTHAGVEKGNKVDFNFLTNTFVKVAKLFKSGHNIQIDLNNAFLKAIGTFAGVKKGGNSETDLTNAFLKAFETVQAKEIDLVSNWTHSDVERIGCYKDDRMRVW